MKKAVMKYRKKPVEIEAMQWDGTAEGAKPIFDWVNPTNTTTARYVERPATLHSIYCRCDGRGIVPGHPRPYPCPETKPTGARPPVLNMETSRQTVVVFAGDWIVRSGDGEFYPLRPEDFEEHWEPVGGATE